MTLKVIIALMAISVISQTGTEPIPVQVVPQGIESVNGSDVNMGCTSSLVDSGGVMVCNSTDCSTSYLLDGSSPAIDTSSSDWASQLVTVRKNDAIPGRIPFDHVVLIFGFDTAVILNSIELNLFLCPEWNIGAPLIAVYGDGNRDLVLRTIQTLIFLGSSYNQPSQSSCDSLSTVSIPLQDDDTRSSYFTVHIVISDDSIDWVHVGEVRFLGTSADPDYTPISTCITPSSGPTTLQSSVTTTNSSINEDNITVTKSTQPSTSTFDTVALRITPTTTSLTAMKSMINSTMIRSTSLPAVSSPSGSPTPPSSSTEDSNTLILYIALVIGLIVLVVILAVVIGLCFIRMRHHSRKQNKAVQNVTELKGITKEHNAPATVDPHKKDGHHFAVTNPNVFVADVSNSMHSRHGKTVTSSLYSEVGDDKDVPQIGYGDSDITTKKRSTETRIIDANGDEFIGVYDVITSDDTAESPAHVLSNQTRIVDTSYDGMYEPITVDASNEVNTTKPLAYAHTTYPLRDLNDTTRTAEEEGSVQLARLYSGIQFRQAPVVPTKSSDLEQYLDTRSVFNVGIHSEPIKPSDFTCTKREEQTATPLIYAPIYPSTTALPECCQQPVDVTCDNVKMKKELRTGQFGEVVLADTKGLSLKDMQLSKTDANRDVSILVVVKKLKQRPSQTERAAFRKEVKFTSRLKHPNVLRLLGVCYTEPAFIMMEYMKEGDLNQFLQRYSEIVTTPSNNTQIATSTVVYMASQIASAMKYLATLNFVHRDLASRNCLVRKNNQIKVADLGVNMKLYQSNYYRIRGNKLLPIRWMATECFSGKFSEKSDVWAFGVTMWELFTLAKRKPYPHLSDEEVIHNALKREYRQFPSRPAACPQPVYEIMEQCWVVDMKQRALFKNLQIMLQNK